MAKNQVSLLQKQTKNKSQTQKPVIAIACRIFLVIKCRFDVYNTEGEKMQKQIQKMLTPRVLFTTLGVAVFSILVLTTIIPVAHWIPVGVTESATVIALTEKGCVVEGSYGYPITVNNCNAQPGETIQVSYNMPAIMESEYMKRVQQRASYVQP